MNPIATATDFDARTQQLIRHLCVASDAPTITTQAPFTGQPVAAIPVSSEAAVSTAFSIASQAQRSWKTTSMHRRSEIMLRFHDLIIERRDEGLDIIQRETGKARSHALEEVLDVAITARYYGRTAARTLRPERLPGPLPLVTTALSLRHPKGVIGIISPWNYPLTLAVSDAIPALMAGNGIVLKPDIQTTLTALWAIDLLYESGLPEGLFGVVAGEGFDVGPMITERGDYIMFTGSTAVGRQVAARCGERLIGCSMELGGKNAMIICHDANLDKAAEVAVRACFANAGQLCISMERIYVDARIRQAFTANFVERVQDMRMIADIGWGADMGSLVSQRQLDTIGAHVDDAVAKGATVLAGGHPRPDIGPLFFEPTVLTNVTDDMVCFGNETFGPVVSVYSFDNEDEAVKLANDTPYGLNASIMVGNLRRGRELAARLHAGTVNINEGYAVAWGSTSAPMGGMGDSGVGRRHGKEGIVKYTESQTIATQRALGWGSPAGLSDKQWGNTLVGIVRALKVVGRR